MGNISDETLLLYAVTDRAWTDREPLVIQIEKALKGGITLLQLREKDMPFEEFVNEAIQVKEICKKYNVPLIINDNLKVAIESGADGVHVGAEDMSVKEIRAIVGNDMIVGSTAKTVEQAKKAMEEGADYLGVGAVFPSSTKKNAIRITVGDLNNISDSVNIPIVAIGGITKDNMNVLHDSKIAGVALVSAIFGADDIEGECRILKNKINSILK